MRWKTLVAMIALSAVALSGCVGGGDVGDDEKAHDDDCEGLEGVAHDECHDHDHQEPTNGNGTNETVPNVPPVAALNMSDDAGNVLDNSTYIMVGQNITFSAVGSSDSDGEVALIGLTVTDRNSTRNAQLISAGQFTDVTMSFDTPGMVNVTMRVLDDDGDGALLFAQTFVNERISDGADLPGADPVGAVSADDCQGPGGSAAGTTLGDQQFTYAGTFSVNQGTRWIEAQVTSGDVEIAICSPEKEALSGASTDSVATDDHPEGLPASVTYRVFAVVKSPGEFTYDVTLHFEPKPAE